MCSFIFIIILFLYYTIIHYTTLIYTHIHIHYTQVLDTCLLTDAEMKVYERTAAKKNSEDALRLLYFPNPK